MGCNPVSSSGCLSGTACVLGVRDDMSGRAYTYCQPAGSGTEGQSCYDYFDCVPGSACFEYAEEVWRCMPYCTLPAGSECRPGTYCWAVEPAIRVGGVEYGVCSS